jgi:hypothetical protein
LFPSKGCLKQLDIEMSDTYNLKTSPEVGYCTAVHCTALHCTALHALHCTALHCTALHCTALHCTALHCTALHCTALHCTALHHFFDSALMHQTALLSPFSPLPGTWLVLGPLPSHMVQQSALSPNTMNPVSRYILST